MGIRFLEGSMKKSAPVEIKCEACNGTGHQVVKQPSQPGRRMYPARCKECDGKGRITKE